MEQTLMNFFFSFTNAVKLVYGNIYALFQTTQHFQTLMNFFLFSFTHAVKLVYGNIYALFQTTQTVRVLSLIGERTKKNGHRNLTENCPLLIQHARD